MSMTCRPLTTAASAALSFGTNNPILSSALARRAIGNAPLTDRTPPVGNLPPPDQRTETGQFPALSKITSLPSQLATVLTLIALTKGEQGKHRPNRENRARIIRFLGHER